MALLKAEHITKTYGQRTIIKDINIELHQGELVCLLGVSGSGKTTLFHILSGLTTPDEGHVYLNDRDITSTPGQISYMLQKDLLLPHKKIIDNVSLPLILKGMKKADARAKADPLFAEFGLDGTQYQYPSQLSGGMRQRVMIAMALACQPQILIADEPTTALDVTIQAQILDLIRDLNQEMNTSVVFITHDLGVVSELCDTVIVMYNGHIVEKAPTADIFREPLHPYTQGLLSAIPRITKERKPLSTIEGMVPNPVERIKGCRFWPRCPKACDRCRKEEPPVFSVGEDRQVRCWLYAQADNGSQEAVTNG